MTKKQLNEAAIAPPPVSDASALIVRKTRKKAAVASLAKPAALRRKAAPRTVVETPKTSIAHLADAVNSPCVFGTREIEERAYQSWIERGCPAGSPEEDWYRAERELIARFATASN